MFDINTILVAMGAGVTYSLTAFAKKEKEKFDYMKFGTTVVIGAAAGVVMEVFQMDLTAANEYIIAIGGVTIVENVFKAVYRKLIKKKK